MRRQDWLVIYLSLPSKSPLIDPIRIMKGLFLFKKEFKERVKDFYTFKPYLYGPCSFGIYDDLIGLHTKGLLDEISSPFSRWSYYRLSRKGQEKALGLKEDAPPDLVAKLQEVKTKVMNLSFSDLLKEVYKMFPEYAKNSVINFGKGL